jgi:hypothetical protein
MIRETTASAKDCTPSATKARLKENIPTKTSTIPTSTEIAKDFSATAPPLASSTRCNLLVKSKPGLNIIIDSYFNHALDEIISRKIYLQPKH